MSSPTPAVYGADLTTWAKSCTKKAWGRYFSH